MGDYNFSGLNPRDFEHLVQTLAKQVVAQGVTPFGDGPDGGREASFTGQMEYPSKPSPWNGALVVQCKFRKRNESKQSDRDWALANLNQEIPKLRRRKRRTALDYYIFATNVTLSAVEGVGGKDKCHVALQALKREGILSDFDIWSYDELCRFVDAQEGIRRAYAGFITTGDVLSAAIRILGIGEPDFQSTIASFVQKEFLHDLGARLESAGHHDDRGQIPIATVFVDLPATTALEHANTPEDHSDSQGQILVRLLEFGSRRLRDLNDVDSQPENEDDDETGRTSFAIVGGPGQGKSTLAQFFCQLYRARLLEGIKRPKLTGEVARAVQQLRKHAAAEGLAFPDVARFPIRIVLNSFAVDLEKNRDLTVLEYVRQRIARLSVSELSLTTLKSWLASYPWLVVFDGLDEVPASSNRRDVLNQIAAFRVDLAALEADALIIATTRPQGYAGDFDPEAFAHYYLRPLSTAQSLRYGQKLIAARCGEDNDRADALTRRLRLACENDATARLMISPLQVTIMVTLVERVGEPPRQRYRLFQEYYRTIYQREVGREGPMSRILRDRENDIDAIHYRTGLLLQTESEIAGRTNANLEDMRFTSLVRHRLTGLQIPEAQVNDLVKEITDSALDRLVFLVRPTAGVVSFEIRSLQEFMAAEALLRGGEDKARMRLEAIAASAHWRNVFLFAVGHCFSVENEILLDHVAHLCADLNDNTASPGRVAARWGSQLALDILNDGVASTNPRRERHLLRVALNVLDIPVTESLGTLVQLYRQPYQDLYEQAISQRIHNPNLESRISSWRLLVALANRGVDWAAHLADQYWRPDDSDSVAILLHSQLTGLGPWARTRIPAAVCAAEPFTFHFGASETRERRVLNEMPDWVRIASNLAIGTSMAPVTVVRAKIGIASDTAKHFQFAVTFGSAKKVRGKHGIQSLADMPKGNPNWVLWRAAGMYARHPGRDSLANALDLIRNEGNLNARTYWLLEALPWPLMACLNWANDKNDLARLSEAARNGVLGEDRDWILAEERWAKNAIQTEDLVRAESAEWPIGKHLADGGFPIFESIVVSHDRNIVEALFALESITRRPKSKVWCRHQMYSALRSRARTQHASVKLPVIKRVLGYPAQEEFITLDWTRWANPSDAAFSEWISTALLAAEKGRVYFSFPSDNPIAHEIDKQVHSGGMSSVGSIRVAAAWRANGFGSGLQEGVWSRLSELHRGNDEVCGMLNLLRLSSDDVSAQDIQELASSLASSLHTLEDHRSWRILGRCASDAVEAVCLVAINSRSPMQRYVLHECYLALDRSIGQRKSAMCVVAIRDKLGVTEMLGPALRDQGQEFQSQRGTGQSRRHDR